MTLGEYDSAYPDADLVQHLLLDWRVRCAVRRAPWELTSSRSAATLSIAVVRTLEAGEPAPDLAEALRAWGSRIASPAEARAALQCLSESVSELVVMELGEFRPRGLDLVLEQLAREALIPAGRRARTEPGPLTRCRDRTALEHDLGAAVRRANATGDDVTVAVLELDDGSPSPDTDGQLLRLHEVVRQVFGTAAGVYRLGSRGLGILMPATGPAAMGRLILRATCSASPRFSWGRANLHSVEMEATGSPDVLLVLAEADMHFRRRDFARASTTVTTHRRLSVVGSIAAGLALVAGASFAVGDGPGAPPAARVAQSARPEPPAPSSSVPTTTVPAPPVPAPAAPAAGAPAAGLVAQASTPAPQPAPAPAPANVVLTSYQTPVPAPSAPPPAPAPPPAAPAPAPSPSPTTTTTVPSPGNSAYAPGHTKKA